MRGRVSDNRGCGRDGDEAVGIHMPFVTGLWPAASQVIGETRGEFLAPASHRLV
jgi:hypothetical protein